MFVLFLLAVVLSVLQFVDSDYSFGMFTLLIFDRLEILECSNLQTDWNTTKTWPGRNLSDFCCCLRGHGTAEFVFLMEASKCDKIRNSISAKVIMHIIDWMCILTWNLASFKPDTFVFILKIILKERTTCENILFVIFVLLFLSLCLYGCSCTNVIPSD